MFFSRRKVEEPKLPASPLKEDIKKLRKKLVNLVDVMLREFEQEMLDKHGDK